MPVRVSRPGVYVEEVHSGIRTISGESTATTAFAGWAPLGATDAAVLCSSWAEYERRFGGLDGRGMLGFAVSHFFANGGARCLILRLSGPADRSATASMDGLELRAIGPGTWANGHTVKTTPQPAPAEHRFRLDVIRNSDGATIESHSDLSLDAADVRSVESVLGGESALLAVTKADPSKKVTASSVALAGGVDGDPLSPDDATFSSALFGDGSTTGFHVLRTADQFNLLNVPGYSDAAKLSELAKFCREARALLIIDADKGTGEAGSTLSDTASPAVTGEGTINAAIYYPWILAPDATQRGRLRAFPPGGAVAGIFARTDANRGVWSAPAGKDATVVGVSGVAVSSTDEQASLLNSNAINCIRRFPTFGTVVWGARTLAGDETEPSEWRYIPVRRTALFIEESLCHGLQWAVFEPNDARLWSQIRLSVGAFLHDLFRQGAFQGFEPRTAYFVKCDEDTTTQSDINHGIVRLDVGFAPLRPAEFVVLRLKQIVGQSVTSARG